jgi:hypothetical protein
MPSYSPELGFDVVGDECWMRVRVDGGLREHRRLNAFGPAGGAAQFGAHDRDMATCARGVYTRIFVCKVTGTAPIYPSLPALHQLLLPFTQALKSESFTLVPWTYPRFVESYDGRKRLRYQQAAESLDRLNVTRKDSFVSTFVKFEKLNLSAKPDPDPRVIQPRDPRFNVAIGVYIRPLEGVLLKLVNKIFGEITVLKGLNSREQGKIIHEKFCSFHDPVIVSLDAIRQDQHMSVSALRYRACLYQMFYHDDPHLAELLTMQETLRGYARDKQDYVKYYKEGGGASGDMDTSLRSCLLSCAIAYAYMRWVNVHMSVINNGDDTTVIVERSDVGKIAGLAEFSKRAGFPMTMGDPVYELEHLEFCQTKPVFDGTEWFMVRDPHVCLSKDLASVKHLDDETSYNTLRNSVGRCGLALAGHMPVYTAFYKALIRGAGTRVDRDATDTGFKILARRMYNSGVVTDAARYSFYVAFDITPDEQVALEEYYAAAKFSWRPTEIVDHFGTPVHTAGFPMGSRA